MAGTLQLIPGIRARAPSVHRWTGRLYILSAFTISLAGLYMMWFRGTIGDLSQHLGNSGLALFIMLCAFMAIRQARARKFESHRRWAIRLFIVVSASLFIRASIILPTMIAGGPVGFDPVTSTGPLLTFVAFAQYLVPLALFEIYLRARNGAPALRIAMAAGLLVLTLATGAGLAAVTATIWVPDIKAGLDARRSITGVLSATIAASGLDSAIAQYHRLRATQPAVYDFDEPELNSLGYTFLRLGKFADAIGIFRLNVQAYPQSANTYDSLGEAYMDAGDKILAIANYQQSLDRNPRNINAVHMLIKLKAK
jgi:tetratricopeptide (TPR) repeat protein